MPIPGLRMRLTALLFALACQTGFAASEVERGLALEADLHSEHPASPETGEPAPQAPPEALPLILSRNILDAPPERLDLPLEVPHLPQNVLRERTNEAATGLLVLLLSLMAIHNGSGWLRMLRRRAAGPVHPIVMEHAHWPSVSILLLPLGSITRQIERIRSLATLEFGYPTARIHFVIAFERNDPGLTNAVAELKQLCPGRIHPLPIPAASGNSLNTLLEAALARSLGDALVVLDQDFPLPANWLRAAITPLLDPATAVVVSRSVFSASRTDLTTRLDLLADRAEAQLAAQEDALALLVSGKACVRALRRQALKTLPSGRLSQMENAAVIAIELTRRGWQSALLDGLSSPATADGAHAGHAGLRFTQTLECLRLFSGLVRRRIPKLARQQAFRASTQAARTLIWQSSLLCALALYFTGSPLLSGIAVLACVASAFDPHGTAETPIRIAALARASGIREEIRLLPLFPLLHLVRTIQGMGRARKPVADTASREVFNEPDKGCEPA